MARSASPGSTVVSVHTSTFCTSCESPTQVLVARVNITVFVNGPPLTAASGPLPARLFA